MTNKKTPKKAKKIPSTEVDKEIKKLIHISTRPANNSRRVQTICSGLSQTIQSASEECNINNIMAKYKNTGQLPLLNNIDPQYGDAPTIDFTEAMQTVTAGQTMFKNLPAEIRAEFNHNPADFLDFTADPANVPELIEMGLMPPLPNQTPQKPSESHTNAPEANIPAAPGKDEAADDQLPS